jgi:hypothetical protein
MLVPCVSIIDVGDDYDATADWEEFCANYPDPPFYLGLCFDPR